MMIEDTMVSIIVEFIRTFVILIYFDVFFVTNKKKNCLINAFFSYFITLVCYLGFHNVSLNLIATIVGILIISYGFKGKIRKKLLLSAMCYIIMFTIDVAASFLFTEYPDSNNYVLGSSFLSVAIFYIVVFCIRIALKRKDEKEISGRWYYLLIVAVFSVIILYLIYIDGSMKGIKIIIISFSLLLINIILYIFYITMLDRFIFMQENQNLKRQMDIYEQTISANIENYNKIYNLQHDMKHHIRELRQLTKQEDLNGINEYLGDMQNELYSVNNMISTGNVMIDGITNYYKSIYEKAGIIFKINITVPVILEIKSYDINIILGNLLDNAYENTVKSESPQVYLDINYDRGVLHIIVKNTYDGEVHTENNRLVSRKIEKNHGYGLNNIQRIIDKYNGQININYDTQIFEVMILMYILL